MRSSISGGFDPGVRLGCVSTGTGGGIEDSDDSEGVIELTRLALEHGVEGVTGRQLVSRLAILNAERAIPRVGRGRSCDSLSPERYKGSKLSKLLLLLVEVAGRSHSRKCISESI